MDEEERAKLYRQQTCARELAALSRWRALSGSGQAYQIRLAQTEALCRDSGWEPVERVLESERAANG